MESGFNKFKFVFSARISNNRLEKNTTGWKKYNDKCIEKLGTGSLTSQSEKMHPKTKKKVQKISNKVQDATSKEIPF